MRIIANANETGIASANTLPSLPLSGQAQAAEIELTKELGAALAKVSSKLEGLCTLSRPTSLAAGRSPSGFSGLW